MGLKIGTLAEMLKTATRECDYTVDGNCSGCGSCCADILPMTRAEIDAIRKYVRAHGIKARSHIGPAIKFDATCPFRDNLTKSCVIYDLRPSICRVYTCNHGKIDKTPEELQGKEYRIMSLRHEIFGDEAAEEMMLLRLLGEATPWRQK